MSTPLSFCDISARYGRTPAPQQTLEEQTGWNPKQFFLDYLQKVRDQREQDAKDAEADALMAMIDAMNASEKDKESGKADKDAADALANAGRAVMAQHETVLEDGTRLVEWFDPTQTLTIQAMLACLGDRFVLEEADKVQENQEEAKEERLEVTEKRNSSESGDPNQIGKEV